MPRNNVSVTPLSTGAGVTLVVHSRALVAVDWVPYWVVWRSHFRSDCLSTGLSRWSGCRARASRWSDKVRRRQRDSPNSLPHCHAGVALGFESHSSVTMVQRRCTRLAARPAYIRRERSPSSWRDGGWCGATGAVGACGAGACGAAGACGGATGAGPALGRFSLGPAPAPCGGAVERSFSWDSRSLRCASRPS